MRRYVFEGASVVIGGAAVVALTRSTGEGFVSPGLTFYVAFVGVIFGHRAWSLVRRRARAEHDRSSL